MKKIFMYLVPIIIILILGTFLINSNLNKENEKEIDDKKQHVEITTTKRKEENMLEGISVNYHASIKMEKDGKVIYFDPYKIDNTLNDADYIFITHSHYDHYSEADIKKVMNDKTKFIVTNDLELKVKALGVNQENITVVYPNKTYNVDNINFNTVTSYNIEKSFHKKSYNWVGYVVSIDNVKYYVVGDSDATEELKNVKCDVIFIPVGGTYTMNAEEAASAVNEMNVKYAIPIHYGEVGSRINAEAFVSDLKENIKSEILK